MEKEAFRTQIKNLFEEKVEFDCSYGVWYSMSDEFPKQSQEVLNLIDKFLDYERRTSK